jgi:hypothetical protein
VRQLLQVGMALLDRCSGLAPKTTLRCEKQLGV